VAAGRGHLRPWHLVAALSILLLTCKPVTATSANQAQPAAAVRQADSTPPQIALRMLPYGFDRPLFLTHAGDGSGRLFIVEKGGTIRIVKDGQVLPTPFLDISRRVGSNSSEQGLLGLAFHPHYRENGRFFVDYTNRQGDTVVEQYRVSADPDLADPASASTVLGIAQPAVNHNGGMLLFGPDGDLWIGTGDGGGSGDRYQNAQNPLTLLGKMLRLDVDHGSPYAIPPDNPYALLEEDVRPEVWAPGLRNPWRYSFDRATGDLWIGDVGQDAYEEIDLVPAVTIATMASGPASDASVPLNFGWPYMEGMHHYAGAPRGEGPPSIPPVAEYGRDGGCSVTGGYVYRGAAYPTLQGLYFFGDFCSGRVWSLDRPGGATGEGAWRMTEQLHQPLQITSFGEDEAGELYATTFTGNTGGQRVYQIVVP
jgi:glucose/arabinose dehydrogenase